jgi:periplasmic divalent cation tolerance protein
MKPIILVSTTLENKADAERIAALLVKRKLIACAQISGPITSIYLWRQVMTNATEFVLSLKTTPPCRETVKTMVIEEHPYDIPEVIVQEIDNSSYEYAQWVYGEVRQCR